MLYLCDIPTEWGTYGPASAPQTTTNWQSEELPVSPVDAIKTTVGEMKPPLPPLGCTAQMGFSG